MAKGKWIDKKSAQHFTLVHRPQNDPLIHDENAPSMVLNPVAQRGGDKGKHLSDLASDLGSDAASIRDNEGEAAEYGIYYDDTEYDYMQHMRDLNQGGGEAVWVEGSATANKGKGKQPQSLEDALRQMDLEHRSEAILDESVLPSKNLSRMNYQSQQNIPDAIAGFQPDMDPRLREVLEALEDEAFVDDEDDDIFQQLARDNEEIDEYEFEEQYDYDDDDGWESDATAKPKKEYKEDGVPELEGKPQAKAAPSELQSSIWTTTTMGGRKKKRKGALTNPSTYSMTSSSMVRTEQLTLLDARFDRIEEEYTSEMGGDDMASVSEMSTVSSVTGPTRGDFDSIMDDFLGSYTKPGKRTNKKNKAQSGLEQLDEIRRGLGPARLRGKAHVSGRG
ncbi:low temperature viability protein [Colletotrichum gloeosporioides Cg-14]|uniref:Low temperature viability protein n=1 Tax=Colletotrichum gloeosporioides (strain Cg-14) TaxID=1237896 RepID=T0K6W3_COLGC|nr:low temperature viability protein [Colletotrichum gloeosporioides Cg-14]